MESKLVTRKAKKQSKAKQNKERLHSDDFKDIFSSNKKLKLCVCAQRKYKALDSMCICILFSSNSVILYMYRNAQNYVCIRQFYIMHAEHMPHYCHWMSHLLIYFIFVELCLYAMLVLSLSLPYITGTRAFIQHVNIYSTRYIL
jgi:hypothetical protein